MLHASWMASLPGDGTSCQVPKRNTLSSLYVVLGAFSHLYHDPTDLKDPGVHYKDSPVRLKDINETRTFINQSQPCKGNAEKPLINQTSPLIHF